MTGGFKKETARRCLSKKVLTSLWTGKETPPSTATLTSFC